MVYRGPSLGCKRCIQRHKSCDKGRPSCSRCLSAGFVCPGYNSTGGVVFKDVTKAVVTREARRAQDKSSTSCSKQLVRLPSRLTTARSSGFFHFLLHPVTAPKLDPFLLSMHFFFQKYLSTTQEGTLLSRGHFDHLRTLYSNARPGSPLVLAAELMGARSMYLYKGKSQNDTLLYSHELAASSALRAAISSSNQRSSDETLLAILCLDFAEHVKSRGTGGAATLAHTRGALALIKGREPGSFESNVSRALYAATISNVLHEALWTQDLSYHDLKVPIVDLQGSNPSIILHQLLLELLQIEAMQDAEAGNPSTQWKIAIAGNVRSMHERLLRWFESVPRGWQQQYFRLKARRREDMLSSSASSSWSSPSSTSESSFFPSMRVAYLFCQWLCTRLNSLQLIHLSQARLHGQSQDQTPDLQEMLREAHTLVIELRLLLPCFETLELYEDACIDFDDPGDLLERNASGTVVIGTGLGAVYVGGAPTGPNYRLNVLKWVVAIMMDPKMVKHGFIFDVATVKWSQRELERVRSELAAEGRRTDVVDVSEGTSLES